MLRKCLENSKLGPFLSCDTCQAVSVLCNADSMERDSSMSRRSMDSASIPEEAESDAELDPTTFDMHSVGDAGSTSDATMPEVVVVANALKPRARPKETAEQLLAAAMALWGLTDIESFWCPQLDVKAVLGWNQDQVVLAFRGTASFANALSDLKVSLCDDAQLLRPMHSSQDCS